jgi:hypothetical protein
MTNTNTNFKTFLLNVVDYIAFGLGLVKRGVCDERIKSEYKLMDPSEIHGYTKAEASKMLNLSTRQFDRRISKGYIKKGRKYQGFKNLYWDKDYIDNMSKMNKQ